MQEKKPDITNNTNTNINANPSPRLYPDLRRSHPHKLRPVVASQTSSQKFADLTRHLRVDSTDMFNELFNSALGCETPYSGLKSNQWSAEKEPEVWSDVEDSISLDDGISKDFSIVDEASVVDHRELDHAHVHMNINENNFSEGYKFDCEDGPLGGTTDYFNWDINNKENLGGDVTIDLDKLFTPLEASIQSSMKLSLVKETQSHLLGKFGCPSNPNFARQKDPRVQASHNINDSNTNQKYDVGNG